MQKKELIEVKVFFSVIDGKTENRTFFSSGLLRFSITFNYKKHEFVNFIETFQ